MERGYKEQGREGKGNCKVVIHSLYIVLPKPRPEDKKFRPQIRSDSHLEQNIDN